MKVLKYLKITLVSNLLLLNHNHRNIHMIRKNDLVEMEIHPRLTALLFYIDKIYRTWGTEMVITSGSELSTRHMRTSLHYSGCATDIRTRRTGVMPSAKAQYKIVRRLINQYCNIIGVPYDWFDLILSSNHMHLEYQPKRII